jgi:hypothetical protein
MLYLLTAFQNAEDVKDSNFVTCFVRVCSVAFYFGGR